MKRIDRRYFFDILKSTSNRQALVSTVYNNTCLAKTPILYAVISAPDRTSATLKVHKALNALDCKCRYSTTQTVIEELPRGRFLGIIYRVDKIELTSFRQFLTYILRVFSTVIARYMGIHPFFIVIE